MKTKLTSLFFGLLLAVILFPFGLHAAVNGQGLTISPPISDITLKPGETVTRTIKVNNPSSEVIEVYPRTMNFKASGETGEPAFYEVGDSSEKFALASWIGFDQTKLALAPEQVIEFDYTISVPEDAEPGGHYGAVFFANEPEASEADTSKVSMGSMIGSLLLVRIPGDIVEKGVLDSFDTDKLFHLKNNVAFTTFVNNSGNVHIKPLGNVVIKDMFGKDVDRVAFNEQGGNVLPDSTRRFTTTWQSSKFLLGRYTADLSLIYGQGEQTLVGSTAFWIIPLWLIIAALVLVGVIVITFIWLAVGRKGPKRRGPKPPLPPQRPMQPPTPPMPPQPQSSEPKGPIILR